MEKVIISQLLQTEHLSTGELSDFFPPPQSRLLSLFKFYSIQ